jgi:predicted amidohydrolase YtcJ
MPSDLFIYNAVIATNSSPAFVDALTIKGGKIEAMGSADQIRSFCGPTTQHIDALGRTIIPGLNDSHLHLIRGGLNYNLELRWDGVPSLADALRMLRQQALRTPAPQWVRVVGGWSELQFAERRMPSLREINDAAPETPVFILHLYDRALLNAAALRAVGYTKDTPDPPGAEIQRDKQGNPTGALIARPNAMLLYSTLAKGPKLDPEYQLNSTRHFMRELNRLGVTSAIDAGGGFQNYPDDYEIIEDLQRRGELTVRLAYNLFTQHPQQEYDDFAKWIDITSPGKGNDFYRMNGAGEMLAFSAADFEDFLEPRPDLSPNMESDLTRVVRLLAEHRWPFRLHATYDESISRFLDVFEQVNREIPFNGLRWFFDHCETISERNLERVRALDGGIAIQHRMAYQGEYFISRYGTAAARQTPPMRRMLDLGIPVGAGTDATRVASYNPWMALYWMVTGKTVGGTAMYDEENCLDRAEALRRYTVGSAWFSGEEQKKGSLAPGQLADLAVLSADYFSVPEEQIKAIESVLTIVDGKIVHASHEFSDQSPAPLAVMPDWSPVNAYGGYYQAERNAAQENPVHARVPHACTPATQAGGLSGSQAKTRQPLWGLGCDCFAF